MSKAWSKPLSKKHMKWLFILLFIFGCFASSAAYGAQEQKQKKKYKWIAISTWILLLILDNTILPHSVGLEVLHKLK
jgi:hypothetical protein